MRDDEQTAVQRPVVSEQWVREMSAQAELEAAVLRGGGTPTFDPLWFNDLARSHELLRARVAEQNALLEQRWSELGKLCTANAELGGALTGRLAGISDDRDAVVSAHALRLLVDGLWAGVAVGALTETMLDGVEAFALHLLTKGGAR